MRYVVTVLLCRTLTNRNSNLFLCGFVWFSHETTPRYYFAREALAVALTLAFLRWPNIPFWLMVFGVGSRPLLFHLLPHCAASPSSFSRTLHDVILSSSQSFQDSDKNISSTRFSDVKRVSSCASTLLREALNRGHWKIACEAFSSTPAQVSRGVYMLQIINVRPEAAMNGEHLCRIVGELSVWVVRPRPHVRD